MRAIRALIVTILLFASLFATVGSAQASDACYESYPGRIPVSCIDNNLTYFRYVRTQVGANPFNYTSLKKRFGKRASDHRGAKMAQLMTLRITHSPYVDPPPTLVRKVPLPSYKAKLVKKYRNRKFVIYQIYADTKPPIVQRETWKFGITSVVPWTDRPESQLPKCDAYYPDSGYQPCFYRKLGTVTGWWNARMMEAGYTLQYAKFHDGKCPPGMPACV
jgi:hypothetical protein